MRSFPEISQLQTRPFEVTLQPPLRIFVGKDLHSAVRDSGVWSRRHQTDIPQSNQNYLEEEDSLIRIILSNTCMSSYSIISSGIVLPASLIRKSLATLKFEIVPVVELNWVNFVSNLLGVWAFWNASFFPWHTIHCPSLSHLPKKRPKVKNRITTILSRLSIQLTSLRVCYIWVKHKKQNTKWRSLYKNLKNTNIKL